MRGANVYPAEVEGALVWHPRVDSAVVVGLPDDDLGQRVHAVVQVTGNLSEDELRDFVTERVEDALSDDAGKTRRSTVRDQEVQLMAPIPQD